MYGLVNKAVKDLVTSKFGEEAWLAIASEAGAPADFVSMQYYPDAMTYALVGAASKSLSLDAASVLEEFGKHWILFTANEGYGTLMDLFGRDFKECLANLNRLHERMGMSMPQLAPPRFGYKELGPNLVQLDYYSKREGLAPMVKGLIEGLAIRHKVKVLVEDRGRREDAHSFVISVEAA